MEKTKVYIAKTTALQNDTVFDKLYHLVSLQRQAKTDRYVNRNDKLLSVGAETLLNFALENEGIKNFKFEYRKNGKPYLKNTDHVFFNLSHSGDTVMCAVSGAEVGCDAETMRDVTFGCATRFFCPKECDFIERGKTEKERKDAFFRLWTLKESFMKATGIGLTLGLGNFCFDLTGNSPVICQTADNETYYFREYDFNDDLKYAVCSKLPDIQDAVMVDFSTL